MPGLRRRSSCDGLRASTTAARGGSPPGSEQAAAGRHTVWRRQVSGTSGGADTQNVGTRLGFKPGTVVQELGWDEDVDDTLRVQVEDVIDGDLVDGDYGNVVDLSLIHI